MNHNEIVELVKFPGYGVSADGVVWSRRGRLTGKGSGNNSHRVGETWRELHPAVWGHGYKRVTMCRDGKKHYRSIHRIVLETFAGPCPSGMQGCHNNGVRADNRIENLRWDTIKNNHADKIAHGTHSRGERSSSAKLNNNDIPIIRARLDAGDLQRDIAADYGVSRKTISDIHVGKKWRHVQP